MKKIGLLILVMVLVSTTVYATPFFVVDAYSPAVNVIEFRGTLDGVSFVTPYALHTQGPAIVYDLQGVDLSVPHTFADVRACNVAGCSTPMISYQTPTTPVAPVSGRFIR